MKRTASATFAQFFILTANTDKKAAQLNYFLGKAAMASDLLIWPLKLIFLAWASNSSRYFILRAVNKNFSWFEKRNSLKYVSTLTRFQFILTFIYLIPVISFILFDSDVLLGPRVFAGWTFAGLASLCRAGLPLPGWPPFAGLASLCRAGLPLPGSYRVEFRPVVDCRADLTKRETLPGKWVFHGISTQGTFIQSSYHLWCLLS